MGRARSGVVETRKTGGSLGKVFMGSMNVEGPTYGNVKVGIGSFDGQGEAAKSSEDTGGIKATSSLMALHFFLICCQ